MHIYMVISCGVLMQRGVNMRPFPLDLVLWVPPPLAVAARLHLAMAEVLLDDSNMVREPYCRTTQAPTVRPIGC